MNLKQKAANAALDFVESEMVVGLGSGSTSACFIEALGEALKSGRFRRIIGVPTSREVEQLAQRLGIPLATLIEHPRPDLAVDGADEIDPHLNLIKGLGGALVREKIVEQSVKRLIIIADGSKTVDTLGTRCPLPVEVVPFCHEIHVEFFRSLGARAELRRKPDGAPFVTDNGNYIYHCRFDRIDNPAALQDALLRHAGVVDSGLFLGMASLALVADDAGVRQIKPL